MASKADNPDATLDDALMWLDFIGRTEHLNERNEVTDRPNEDLDIRHGGPEQRNESLEERGSRGRKPKLLKKLRRQKSVIKKLQKENLKLQEEKNVADDRLNSLEAKNERKMTSNDDDTDALPLLQTTQQLVDANEEIRRLRNENIGLRKKIFEFELSAMPYPPTKLSRKYHQLRTKVLSTDYGYGSSNANSLSSSLNASGPNSSGTKSVDEDLIKALKSENRLLKKENENLLEKLHDEDNFWL